VATNEGDGRNEGGTAKSEWISVGAAKTTTSGGGRSIAPYPHTHTPIVSMSAREWASWIPQSAEL